MGGAGVGVGGAAGLIRYLAGLIALVFAFQSGLSAPSTDSANAFVESVYHDYANPDVKRQDQRQAKF